MKNLRDTTKQALSQLALDGYFQDFLQEIQLETINAIGHADEVEALTRLRILNAQKEIIERLHGVAVLCKQETENV